MNIGDKNNNENLSTVRNDAPESKFQNDQQVQATEDGAKVSAGDSSFVKKPTKTRGYSMKIEKAASLVQNDSKAGSIAGDGATFYALGAGGDASENVAGSYASSPKAEQRRSDTRWGKKLDKNTTKLDYIPTEIPLVEWDEAPDLASNPEDTEGFNGTYRNSDARSQKKTGNTPAELLFDRSVDVIRKDQIYFGDGQFIDGVGEGATDYSPTETIKVNDQGRYIDAGPNSYEEKAGNYITRDATMEFYNDGSVRALYFNEDDITGQAVDTAVLEKSSLAKKIAVNKAELVREVMDTKAGDEKADIWTPIARAVKQPTQTVGYLHDMEQDVGNEIFIAYKKLGLSHSYQLNRAHKDGQFLNEPMVDAMLGHLKFFASTGDVQKECPSITDLLRGSKAKRYNSYGSAGLWINMNDSVGKYKTKADILTFPKSVRLALQTADSNMNPLRASKRFLQLFTSGELFGTIDHEPDPMLPVVMTDKAVVTHRYSWNSNGAYLKLRTLRMQFTKGSDMIASPYIPAQFLNRVVGKYAIAISAVTGASVGEKVSREGDTNSFTFSKTGKEAPERIKLVPFTSTLKDGDSIPNDVFTGSDAKEHQYYYYNIANDGGAVTISGPGLNSLDMGSETDLVVNPLEFGYTYHDLRNDYYTVVSNYLCQGLVDLFDQGVGRSATNYLDKDECGRYYLKMPTVHSTKYFSLWSILLCASTPFIVKHRINAMRDVLYYEKNIEYPFDDLIALSEASAQSFRNIGYSSYDLELTAKVISPVAALRVRFPEILEEVGHNNSSSKTYIRGPLYFNENNYNEDGTENTGAANYTYPSIRSGVKLGGMDSLYSIKPKDFRLSMDCISSFASISNKMKYAYKYSMTSDGLPIFELNDTDLPSVHAFLKLPRELGFLVDAPYGLLSPELSQTNIGEFSDYDFSKRISLNATSYAIDFYTGENPVKFIRAEGDQAILNPTAMSINRGQNFRQTFHTILASGTAPDNDFGFVLSLNALDDKDNGKDVYGSSIFLPYVSDKGKVAKTNADLYKVKSLQKALWTRIQKLPFMVSPFDVSAKSDGNNYDTLDFLYYFNVGGFRAVDYRESVYNRSNFVDTQGYLFVTDPWVDDSPLFREGAASSGISVSKGFKA